MQVSRAAKFLEAGILGANLVVEPKAMLPESLCQGRIRRGQDLGRQQTGIGAIADRHRGHGDSGRHLHDRME